MIIHPRTIVVKDAEREVDLSLSAAVKKYKLTFGEVFKILTTLMSNWVAYQIREERR